MNGPITIPTAIGTPNRAVFYKQGQNILASQMHAQSAALVSMLEPNTTHILNLCACRLHFTLGFGATLLAEKTSLLPANYQPLTILKVLEAYPDSLVLFDGEREPDIQQLHKRANFASLDIRKLAGIKPDMRVAATNNATANLDTLDAKHLAAIVFTSGSTGEPTEIKKHWGTLVGTTQLLQERFNMSADEVSILATVPPQHMYGLETTVMMNLYGGIPASAAQPFFPADIVRELAQLPEPRLLITTPFHLETLLESDLPLPSVDTVICATAPLKLETAERAEQLLGCNVKEIYGCSEAGSLATRRTAQEAIWELLDGITIANIENEPTVSAAHLDADVALQDEIEILAPERFRFLGRSADMVNVAGKRGSLSQLSAQLTALDGVSDALFFLRDEDANGLQRPAALVVSEKSERELKKALAQLIDPVFMPRPLKRVSSIPRNAVGKTPRAELLAALKSS